MAKNKITVMLELEGGKKVKATLDGIDVTAKKVTGSVGGLRTKLSEFGNIATGINSVVSMMGRLYGQVEKTIDLYRVQEQAEKSLETALGRRSDELLNYASAMQEATIHGDEEIIQAQALLAMFTDEEDQIKELTKRTLDLADAKGMDLKAAADLVSKTIGSSTNALSRYGIEVTGAVGSQERLNSLLLNIDERFGGQAYAKAETETGKLTQSSNRFGDSLERIGELTVSVIEPLSTISSNVFSSVVSTLLPVERGIEKVTSATGLQRAEFDSLAETYLNLKGKVNLTKQETDLLNNVIDELQKKYPNYLKNIDLETAGYEEAETAIKSARFELDRYIDSLLKKAAVQANEEQLIELSKRAYQITKQRIEAENKLAQLTADEANKQAGIVRMPGMRIAAGLAGGGATEGELFQSEIDTQKRLYENTISEINTLREQKQQVLDELDLLINSVVAPSDGEGGGGLSRVQVQAMTYMEIEEELLRVRKNSAAITMQLSKSVTDNEREQLKKAEEIAKAKVKILETEKEAIAAAVEQQILASASAYNAEKSFGVNLANEISKRIKAYIAEAVAGSVSKTLASIPFPANLLLAAGAGTATSAALEAVIPEFYTGVRDFGGGLAKVGERGEEFVYMPEGSNVYNNAETRRISDTLELLAGSRNIPVSANVDVGGIIEAVNRLEGKVTSMEKIYIPVDSIDAALNEKHYQDNEIGHG